MSLFFTFIFKPNFLYEDFLSFFPFRFFDDDEVMTSLIYALANYRKNSIQSNH